MHHGGGYGMAGLLGGLDLFKRVAMHILPQLFRKFFVDLGGAAGHHRLPLDRIVPLIQPFHLFRSFSLLNPVALLNNFLPRNNPFLLFCFFSGQHLRKLLLVELVLAGI